MADPTPLFAQAGYETLVPLLRESLPDGTARIATLSSAGTTLPDQFTLFQMTDDPAAPIADLHDRPAVLKGSDQAPDAQVRIDLVSFKVAEGVIDQDMQATLRLDMGEAQSSSLDHDPLFWSIAAGLDLAARAVTGGDTEQKSAEFGSAFRRRPIEIAGGAARLRVQLVAHKPPPWWRRIFAFADNAAVKQLVSAVGFPGIALDAVKLLDETLSRFEDAAARPILQSQFLNVVLTDRAAQDFSGGLATVKPAVLNTGIYLLLRDADARLVRKTPPIYLGGQGELVPASWWKDGHLIRQADDPYEAMSYVVLRVKTREAQAAKF